MDEDKQRRANRIRNRRRDRLKQTPFTDGPRLRAPQSNSPRVRIDPRYCDEDDFDELEEYYAFDDN
jgi:hypothetical protein